MGLHQTPYAPSEALLNAQGVYLTASSVYSNYSPWKAMDGNLNAPHAFSHTDSSPWLNIQMPHKLKDMVVLVGNSSIAGTTTYPFISSGTFHGSTNGSSWIQIGTFSGHSATSAFVVSEFQINNATAHNYLRISMTKPGSATRMALFDLRIRGIIVD